MKNLKETILFDCDNINHLRIIYKNGKTYNVKKPDSVSVVQRIGGGCDIFYVEEIIFLTPYGKKTVLDIHETQTEDVVAIELKGAIINGYYIDKMTRRFP